MEEILRRADEVEAAAEFLRGADFLYFIGRGPSLAAAHQGALTFNEGARLPTCALPGGTFRHGPFELVGPDFAAVLLAPAGRTVDLATGMAREVAQAGGRVLLLTDRPAPVARGLHVLRLPARDEDLFGLQACVPLELLLYHVALQRGRQAGVFERITKVTRRE
jgi:glucosamine--fructose-6-phosphate aminotransferase (isomerizing)